MKDTRVYKQTDHCSISADIYDQGPGSPVIIYQLAENTRDFSHADESASVEA